MASSKLMGDGMSFAVVGSPGHGKSTFLNGMMLSLCTNRDSLKRDGLFVASADGKQSCTKNVSQKTFSAMTYLKDQGRKVIFTGQSCSLTLVDTMGFPDPDRSVAAKFYDSVVTEAVNREEGLNAVVWVLNHDRPDEEQFKKFGALMNEIKSANCKFVVVVNGKEDYSGDAFEFEYPSEEERKNKIEADRENMRESCEMLLKRIGMWPQTDDEPTVEIIASTCKQEFQKEVPKLLMAHLAGTHPKVSHVQTFASLKKIFESADESFKHKLQQALAAQQKIDEETRNNEKQQRRLEDQKAKAIAMQEKTHLELLIKEAQEQKLALQRMGTDVNEQKTAALKLQRESEIQIHNERLREANRGVNQRKEDLWKEYEYYFEHSAGRWFAGVFTVGISEASAAAGRERYRQKLAALDELIASNNLAMRTDTEDPGEAERIRKNEEEQAAIQRAERRVREEKEALSKRKREKEEQARKAEADMAALQMKTAAQLAKLKAERDEAERQREALREEAKKARREFKRLETYLVVEEQKQHWSRL